MTTHFNFNNGDWRNSNSRIFANELYQARPIIRDRICRQFGISLGFDSEGIKVDYDGRKVGFGSFCNEQGRTTFSIAPKVDDFDINALFKCIDTLHLFNRIVQFDNSQKADIHEEQDDSFSWTFLLGLLEDINDFGIHNFLIFNSKKTIKGRSSIVGRPVAKSLVLNMAHGKFGVDCEVLDNYRQRQYASLFFATAQSIFHDLIKWQSVIKRSDSSLTGTYNSIAAKLKQFSDIPFSRSLLRELAHPPFTYGVKTLLVKCIRYWKWKGIFATTNSNSLGTFWSVSMALDTAFELYAGHMIGNMLTGADKRPKQGYPYSLDTSNNKINREIEPDHIYLLPENAGLIIAEIKYSTHLAIREHVAQLLAYLKYNAYPFDADKKMGLLVYPGKELSCQKISNFDANIYLVTLPAKEEFATTTPTLNFSPLLA